MENIEVSVRLRPLNLREIAEEDESVWSTQSNGKTIKCTDPSMVGKEQNQMSGSSRQPKQQQVYTASTINVQSSPIISSGFKNQAFGQRSISPMNSKQKTNMISNKAKTHQEGRPQLNKTQESARNISASPLRSLSPTVNTSGSAAANQEPKKDISYSFDLCFGEEVTNSQIYQSMVKRIALSSLNGINGTVFVYGQTGSGKTYTMLGRERKEVIEIPQKLQNQSNQNSHNKKQQKTNKQEKTDKSPNNKLTQKDNQNTSPGMLQSTNKDNSTLNSSCTADILTSTVGLEAAYLSGKQQSTQLEQPGVLIYAFEDIFNEIKQDKEKTYFLRCSYVEIYNEQVYDLLRDEDIINESLSLNEDKNKDFYIRGVIEEPVQSVEEILYFLRRGELNRHYAQTKLNHTSSRSHTLFRLQVQSITNNFLQQSSIETKNGNEINLPLSELCKSTIENASNKTEKEIKSQQQKEPSKEARKYVTQSVLNFVDLAGSEKVSSHYENKNPDELYTLKFGEQSPKIDSKVKTRINEGKNINKSLFFLTQVISLRAEGKSSTANGGNNCNSSNQFQQAHIPYRNSPLTKILRSSLGGNARTSVIVCVTPCKSQFEQTLSSLRFGQNAMKIENKVHANIITNNNEEAVKILISDYDRKIKSLEKVKKDQQNKRDNEMRMIDVLLEEKKRLIDKINQNNLKKFKTLVTSTGQSHLLDQQLMKFCQEKFSTMVSMGGVGDLEISEPLAQLINKKYDKQSLDNSLKSNYNNNKQHFQHYQQYQWPSFQQNSNSNISQQQQQQNSYIEQSFKELAMEAISQQQTTKLAYQEQIASFQDCILDLQAKNVKLQDTLSRAEEMLNHRIDSSTKLNNKFFGLQSEIEVLKLKENFYEGFDNEYIRLVKDDWIVQLEGKFAHLVERLRQEKTRRHYKVKIEGLQNQIKALKSQNPNHCELKDQQQTLDSVLQLLQQSECQSQRDGVSLRPEEIQEQCNILHQFVNDKVLKSQSDSLNEDTISYNQHKDEVQQTIKQCGIVIYDNSDDTSSEQENSLTSRMSLLKRQIKVRENTLSECDIKINLIQQSLQGSLPSLRDIGLLYNSSSNNKHNNCMPTVKQSCSKVQNKTKSLQIGSVKKFNSIKQQEISMVGGTHSQQQKQQPTDLSPKSFLLSSLSENNFKQATDISQNQTLQEEQESSLALLTNMNNLGAKPTSGTSMLHQIASDLENVLLGNNNNQNNLTKQSFQLETSQISQKSQSNSNNEEHFEQSDDNNDDDNDYGDGDERCRNLESFALTHRESKHDIQSNNIFETLQANLDQFSHNNELIVNANDYVSFKQTSNKKTTQFTVECQLQTQLQNDETYNNIAYISSESQLTECFDDALQMQTDNHYSCGEHQSEDEMLSLNFREQSFSQDNDTASFKQEDTTTFKDISNNTPNGDGRKQKLQLTNSSQGKQQENSGKSYQEQLYQQYKGQPNSKNYEMVTPVHHLNKNPSQQHLTHNSKKDQFLIGRSQSPMSKTPSKGSEKMASKKPQLKQAATKQSVIQTQQKYLPKSGGEAKIFQPLLQKSRQQLASGVVSSRNNTSSLMLTGEELNRSQLVPQQQLQKQNSNRPTTPMHYK